MQSSGRGRAVVLVSVAATAVAGTAAAYGVRRLFGKRPDLQRDGLEAGPPPGGDVDLVPPEGIVSHDVLTADGGCLHVIEKGRGPVVVLLHGAGLTAGVWSYQLRDLAGSRRIVALDQRGHGASAPGHDGVTIAAMADDLATVLDRLDLVSVLLVGHSMGGMAVLRFARHHHEVLAKRVRAILLVSTTGGVVRGGSPLERLAPLAESIGRRVARAGRSYPGGLIGARAARLGFGANPIPAHLQATSRLMSSNPPSRLAGLMPELVAFDERSRFDDLDIAVTVLVGDHDLLTPPARAEALAHSIPGADLRIWPGGGHMLMYERRADFARLLEELSEPAPPI
ncbi:MAG: alpha/beta fold hydrolase [Acidimicrobiales bacterium]